MNDYPAILVISASSITFVYNFIKKRNKFITIILLIALLGSIMFLQLKHSDSLIKNKIPSYMEVKQAGLWLKENSEPSDVILTRSPHQIKHYSERVVIDIPHEKEELEELEKLISSNSDIKFFMVSRFERHEPFIYSYPEENKLMVVKAYFADANQQQPILVIYRM